MIISGVDVWKGTTMTGDSAQHLAIMQARNKAFRWPKGKSGRTEMVRFYYEARRIARQASPATMKELVRLSLEAEDERVRSVCCVAVLDRAGVKPIDFDPNEERSEEPEFNPRDYSAEELEVIEAALKLIVEKRRAESQEGSDVAGPSLRSFRLSSIDL
jgi:hypothetical protein